MELWPFASMPTNKKVRAYEEDGRWFIELEFDVDDIEDPRRVIHYDIPKIVLPRIESCNFEKIYCGTDPKRMFIDIHDSKIPIEEVLTPAFSERPFGVMSVRKFKEEKEMTMAEIEEALGHGVILKGEAHEK